MISQLSLSGKKILFATVPDDSHINPLTGLAKYLMDAGAEVCWYTSGIYEEKLKRLNIPHIGFSTALDINPINIEFALPGRNKITDQAEKQNYDLINVFAKRSSEYFTDIKAILKTFPFELMISDSMFSAIPLVKTKLNIPVVSVGIFPLAEDSSALASYGMALPPAATENQFDEYGKVRDYANKVLYKRSIDIYDTILKENKVYVKRSILPDLLIKQSDLHLQIGSAGFEYKRSDLGHNIRFIGPLMPYSNRKTSDIWFDVRLLKHDRIILVSQGTAEQDTKKLIEPTLEAFKNTEYLVIATTGGNNTKALREKFPEKNIIIENYIPFDDVMPYVSICITNGGYLTTLASITHKAPVITAGLTGSKNEVGARISYFNCGINLNTDVPEPRLIRDAVKKIFAKEVYKRSVGLLSEEFKKYDPKKLCLIYISELLNETVSISRND